MRAYAGVLGGSHNLALMFPRRASIIQAAIAMSGLS